MLIKNEKKTKTDGYIRITDKKFKMFLKFLKL